MTGSSARDRFLEGRGALITGGLSGQGLAIAHELAAHGANVAVGSHLAAPGAVAADAAYYPGKDEIDTLHQALARNGSQVYAAHLDVRDSAVIDGFVAAATAVVGQIDILVNAAGTTAEQGVVGHSDALWERILDTNLTGAFRMTRACLPGMIERRWGRIINIGSTAATVGWKDNPAYCASKAGLLGLTRCVALEGAAHGVGCTMISPTWVETELMRRNTEQVAAREGKGRSGADLMAEIAAQNPQQRIIQPGEIAATAAFLCRDAAYGLSMDNIQITGGALW